MIGNVYYFEVTGRGDFPHSLLAQQSCFPKEKEDAAYAFKRSGSLRTVKMKGLIKPNMDLWRSYGWSVLCFSDLSEEEDYTLYHTWPC